MNESQIFILVFLVGMLFPFAVAGICATVQVLWGMYKEKNAKGNEDEEK